MKGHHKLKLTAAFMEDALIRVRREPELRQANRAPTAGGPHPLGRCKMGNGKSSAT